MINKISINELKGQNLIDFKKEGHKLLVNLEKEGWCMVACSECGETEVPLNRNLRECPCGKKEFLKLGQ